MRSGEGRGWVEKILSGVKETLGGSEACFGSLGDAGGPVRRLESRESFFSIGECEEGKAAKDRKRLLSFVGFPCEGERE